METDNDTLPDDFAVFLLTGNATQVRSPATLILIGDLSRPSITRPRLAALWRRYEPSLRQFAEAHQIRKPGDDYFGARLAAEVEREARYQ